MEEVFVDKKVDAKAINKVFSSLFPDLRLFQWFVMIGEEDPVGFNPENPAHILFEISYEPRRLEFHWRLSCYRTPNEDYEERQKLVAKQLSKELSTRTLITYQLPEAPDDPFYDLVYDSGLCYLADDSMFSWTGESDEPSEPIKLLRPIEVTEVHFDSFGRLIK